MATTYTTRAALAKPATGDTGWGPTIDGDLDQLDAVQAIGALAVTLHEVPSASLNIAVAAGVFISSTGGYVTFAGSASFAVTTAISNYLWLTDAGTLTKGTAWPAGGTKVVRLAVVVAGASTITSITDARCPFISAG